MFSQEQIESVYGKDFFSVFKLSPHRAFIVINPKLDDDMWHRTLFEEFFHALAGEYGPLTLGLFGYTIEVINDFLMLMFFPPSQFPNFKSPYTQWSNSQKAALQKRYIEELGLNPNTDLRVIVEALRDDLKNNYRIQVGNTRRILSKMLPHPRKATPETKKQFGKSGVEYLEHILLPRERFNQYQPLFPNWSLPVQTRSEVRVVPTIPISLGLNQQVLSRGSLLIPANDLADLTREQQDELVKVIETSQSELRLVIYDDHGQIPLGPAFDTLLRLNNVFFSHDTVSNAYRKYGIPESAGVNLSKEDRGKENVVGMLPPRIKSIRLKEEVGRIAFARLLIVNGGQLPGVTEVNGFIEPSQEMLSFIQQEYLNHLVIAYAA